MYFLLKQILEFLFLRFLRNLFVDRVWVFWIFFFVFSSLGEQIFRTSIKYISPIHITPKKNSIFYVLRRSMLLVSFESNSLLLSSNATTSNTSRSKKKPSMKVKRKNEEQNYACAFFWLNKVSIFHSFRNACIHLYISHTENSTFATVMQKHQMCPVQHMPSKQKKKNHRKLHGNWIQWVKKKEKRTEWELANF